LGRPIDDLGSRVTRRELDDIGEWDEIGRLDARQNTALKRMLARFALWTMAAQLAATHVVFLLYGVRHWTVHDGVMITYLTENFAQVVAIVLVITRHLFPSPGGPGD
jgi:hypothetical protein